MNVITLIKWHLDALFAMHNDMWSLSGAVMSFGKERFRQSRASRRSILTALRRQSSTIFWRAECGPDYSRNHKAKWWKTLCFVTIRVPWSLRQMARQALARELDILTSKYFLITDLIARNEVSLQFCPNDLMIADYMTKPLVGKECVGKSIRWVVMLLLPRGAAIKVCSCTLHTPENLTYFDLCRVSDQNSALSMCHVYSPRARSVVSSGQSVIPQFLLLSHFLNHVMCLWLPDSVCVSAENGEKEIDVVEYLKVQIHLQAKLMGSRRWWQFPRDEYPPK